MSVLTKYILAIIVTTAIVGSGIFIFINNKPPTKSSNLNDQAPTTSEPDLYAGWKTYAVPEDPSISFKYPADWDVVADFHDTATKLTWNRTAIFATPTKYYDDYFVLRFYYSPGKTNALTWQCTEYNRQVSPSSIKKLEDIVVGDKKLKLLTTEGSIIKDIISTSMQLVDSSDCTVAVPSGSIQMSQSYGVQSIPDHNIDAATWASLPESTIFGLIFRSLRY